MKCEAYHLGTWFTKVAIFIKVPTNTAVLPTCCVIFYVNRLVITHVHRELNELSLPFNDNKVKI